MENLLLSIIVPIYKAEQYIEKCIVSLMEQTMREGIEFIFINDCTPDKSMDILYDVIRKYPERMHQIRIIENDKNKGVSLTRKIGVDIARGDYIGWCDSDDWVELDMYESLFRATQNGKIDIVVCSFYNEQREKTEQVRYNKCNTPQECIINCWKGFFFPGSLWQQINRKSLIQRAMNQIVQVDYAEDVYSLLLVYYWASSIAYIERPLYHYNSLNVLSLVHNTVFTKESWNRQRKNLELITQILYGNGGKKIYHIACNAMKYSMKKHFISSFSNIREYYYTFSECYRDVNYYLFSPNNIKTYLVYNVYILFYLYYSADFKRKALKNR